MARADVAGVVEPADRVGDRLRARPERDAQVLPRGRVIARDAVDGDPRSEAEREAERQHTLYGVGRCRGGERESRAGVVIAGSRLPVAARRAFTISANVRSSPVARYRRGPRPGCKTAACTAATSRTSAIGMPPTTMTRARELTSSRARVARSPRCGSCGPHTIPGYTIVSGAPTSWRLRAIRSLSALDRW